MGNQLAEVISATNKAITNRIEELGTNRGAVASRAHISRATFDRNIDGDGANWKVWQLGNVAAVLDMQFPDILVRAQDAMKAPDAA